MRNPPARTTGTDSFPPGVIVLMRGIAGAYSRAFRLAAGMVTLCRAAGMGAFLALAPTLSSTTFAQQPALHPVALQVIEAGIAPPEGEPIKCGLPGITHAIHQIPDRTLPGIQSLQKILSRPVMQTSVINGGFRVHFDTTGLNAPAMLDGAGNRLPGTAREYVDSIFSILSFVTPLESETLGYGALRTDGDNGGGPEYDIYVMELGNMYGYTTPDAGGPEGIDIPDIHHHRQRFRFCPSERQPRIARPSRDTRP